MDGRGKRSKSNKRPLNETPSSSENLLPLLDTMGIGFRTRLENAKFTKLGVKDVKSTQFPDLPTLRTLDIHANIRELHRGLGSTGYLQLQAKTYTKLTLEFLCTMTKRTGPSIDESTGEEFEEVFMDFRLENNEYTVSLTELNSILRWPSNRNHDNDIPIRFSERQFWRQITGRTDYSSRTAKASLIVHPVLRVLHRIYACTVFAREDKGTINKTEMFLLWSFVTGYNEVNMGGLLLEHLLRHEAANFTGDIHVGGMITLIAKYVGIRIPETGPQAWEPVRGSRLLDIKTLKMMKMIDDYNEGRFIWYVGGGDNKQEYTILPDDNLTVVEVGQIPTWFIPRNWEGNQGMGQEEEEMEEAAPNQMPPEFYNQFNEMRVQQNQIFEQNTQILQQLTQFTHGFNQFQTNIEGRVQHTQGRVDHIYEYGMAHWEGFRPPPPPSP